MSLVRNLIVMISLTIVLPIHGQQDRTQSASNKNDADTNSNSSLPNLRKTECVVQENGTAIKCQWAEEQPHSFFDRLFTAENTPNIALFFVGLGGVIAAICTLVKIERQTAATEQQAKHMVDSERPFLIAYARGWNVWVKNCGKSPAQLIAFSPFMPLYPAFVQEANGWPMPKPPQYGTFYNDAIQLNIGWVGPGERRQIEYFDPTLVRLRGDATNQFFMFGAVKYRGMFGDQKKPFETRYCYGFVGDPFDPSASIFMGGDYGYNQNT